MADPNKWATALAVAPVAGVLGALARFKPLAANLEAEQEVKDENRS